MQKNKIDFSKILDQNTPFLLKHHLHIVIYIPKYDIHNDTTSQVMNYTTIHTISGNTETHRNCVMFLRQTRIILMMIQFIIISIIARIRNSQEQEQTTKAELSLFMCILYEFT